MKKCKTCNQVKSFNSFYARRANSDGHQYICKECQSVRLAEKYRENPAHFRERQYKRLYGITYDDAFNLLKHQGGVCAVCASPVDFNVRTRSSKAGMAVVDHCHTTGKVRGILCHFCNIGIGHLKDDVTIVEKAFSYLKESS